VTKVRRAIGLNAAKVARSSAVVTAERGGGRAAGVPVAALATATALEERAGLEARVGAPVAGAPAHVELREAVVAPVRAVRGRVAP
jgi:hypothetical protein